MTDFDMDWGDQKIYRVTYKYMSTLGQMPCGMSGEALVQGIGAVRQVKEFIERNGVTEIWIEPYHAPVLADTFGKLAKSFNDFPPTVGN